MYDMTVNMELVVVFHHVVLLLLLFYILSCIERIHVSWCTTVRITSIVIIIITYKSYKTIIHCENENKNLSISEPLNN